MANFLELIGMGKGADARPRAFLIGLLLLAEAVTAGLLFAELEQVRELQKELLHSEAEKTKMEREFRAEIKEINREAAEAERLSKQAEADVKAAESTLKKLK